MDFQMPQWHGFHPFGNFFFGIFIVKASNCLEETICRSLHRPESFSQATWKIFGIFNHNAHESIDVLWQNSKSR